MTLGGAGAVDEPVAVVAEGRRAEPHHRHVHIRQSVLCGNADQDRGSASGKRCGGDGAKATMHHLAIPSAPTKALRIMSIM